MTTESKATLAELIYRSQKGEEIDVNIGFWRPLSDYLEGNFPFTPSQLGVLETYRIKPRKVTITREILVKAWAKCILNEHGEFNSATGDIFLEQLCKELGL